MSKRNTLTFNEDVFESILRSAGVKSLTREAAEKALERAKATAPVATGAYRDGLLIQTLRGHTRDVYLVVGTDWKTMLVEAKTGNLARALKGIR